MSDVNLPPGPSKNVEKEMAEHLAGFKALERFRKFCYQAAIAAAIIAGAAKGSQEGAKQGLITGFYTGIFGLAGARLLTSPIGAWLWYRHWKCPSCGKRLGMTPSETCPHCGAKLFTRPQ